MTCNNNRGFSISPPTGTIFSPSVSNQIMNFQTRQETVRNLLTCGICNKLCREVAVIEECCHTFCWKCIYKKLAREKCRNCPECNADLGGAPLLKIKTDYKWQSIRDNFKNIRQKLIDFGLMKPRAKGLGQASNHARNDSESSEEKGNSKEHEIPLLEEAIPEKVAQDREENGDELEVLVHVKGKDKVVTELDNEDGYSSFPLTMPIRRKKRSVTAVVDATEAPRQAAAPRAERGRRKAFARKITNPRRSPASSDSEETDSDEDYTVGSENRRRRIRKAAKIKEQNPCAIEHFNENMRLEPRVGMNESVKPLDYTVEGASKSMPENVEVVQDCKSNDPGETNMDADSGSNHPHQQDHNNNMLLEDLNIPTHIVIDSATVYRRARPIWFQLVASDIQENYCCALPSLPPCYIQVKDFNMPASCIKKYLVVKLGLGSEDELEIRMRGELIHPETQMHQLVELWVQTATRSESEKWAAVGRSDKDFVMVFAYSWSSGADQF